MFGRTNGSSNSGGEAPPQAALQQSGIPPLRTFRVWYYAWYCADDKRSQLEMFVYAHVVQITASGALVFAEGYWNAFLGTIAERYPQVFNACEWARYEEVIVPEASGLII